MTIEEKLKQLDPEAREALGNFVDKILQQRPQENAEPKHQIEHASEPLRYRVISNLKWLPRVDKRTGPGPSFKVTYQPSLEAAQAFQETLDGFSIILGPLPEKLERCGLPLGAMDEGQGAHDIAHRWDELVDGEEDDFPKQAPNKGQIADLLRHLGTVDDDDHVWLPQTERLPGGATGLGRGKYTRKPAYRRGT